MMPRSPARPALGIIAAALLIACRRERPAPPAADAGAPAIAALVDAAPELVPDPIASSPAVTDAAAAPVAATNAADLPLLLGPSRPSAIVQCKSSALSRDAAVGLADDRTLDCPLAISDRTQRPPWRGALDAPLTKQRRAVAGVAKDDCCYAMAASTGTHRGR